jgi:hypothetical protein
MAKKPMSDSEVHDYVSNKLMGDLDGIEAHNIFAENDQPSADPHTGEGVKIQAHGVSVELKPMAGEQTKEMPKTESAPEEDEDLSELGL